MILSPRRVIKDKLEFCGERSVLRPFHGTIHRFDPCTLENLPLELIPPVQRSQDAGYPLLAISAERHDKPVVIHNVCT